MIKSIAGSVNKLLFKWDKKKIKNVIPQVFIVLFFIVLCAITFTNVDNVGTFSSLSLLSSTKFIVSINIVWKLIGGILGIILSLYLLYVYNFRIIKIKNEKKFSIKLFFILIIVLCVAVTLSVFVYLNVSDSNWIATRQLD